MPSRSGDVPKATTEFATTPTLGEERVLAELCLLASIEHALCVEYLVIECALGHGQALADTGDVAQRVSKAAASASDLARNEMRHLHLVNRALVAANHPPCVERATSITDDSGSTLALVPPRLAEAADFLDRTHAVAVAVDQRYARLRRAVAPEYSALDGTALEQLSFMLDPAPDHTTPVETLATQLERLTPPQYLRATRHEPRDELERRLLSLSNSYYSLIVATVEAWFADEDRVGGVLSGRAISLMDGLNEINGFLVKRGLMPQFMQIGEAVSASPSP